MRIRNKFDLIWKPINLISVLVLRMVFCFGFIMLLEQNQLIERHWVIDFSIIVFIITPIINELKWIDWKRVKGQK